MARQFIIQCPACQTKFALDSAVIDGVEDPRFHCSRCDNLFSLDESKKGSMVQVRKAEPRVFTPPSAAEPVVEPGFDSAPWDNEPAEPTSSKQLSVPTSFEPDYQPTAPHETAELPTDAVAETTVQMNLPLSIPEREQEILPQETPEIEPGHQHFSVREAQDFIEPFQSPPKQSEPSPTMSADELMRALSEKVAGVSSAASAQIESRSVMPERPAFLRPHRSEWRDFALLASPLMAFLALLFTGAIYLRNNQQAGATFLNAFYPSAAKVAPVGVYINNTKVQRVVLDSGDTVLVISGKLLNRTEESFSEVLVEALGFDHSGKPILRTKAQIPSALSKSKIRSLTPSMIADIQTDHPKKPGLKAGASADFAVALGLGEGSSLLGNVRYFSARIYSVRN